MNWLYAWGRVVPMVLLPALLQAGVHAQEEVRPSISFGGFGTFGAIHSSESRADFAENIRRSTGPGHSRSVDGSVDSRLAAQASARLGPRFTAVLQVMVEANPAGDYRPRAEWANVSFAVTPDVNVRVGRIVLPAFLVSDARKVSFAMPWLRPPVELYGLAPIYSLDGADASYTRRLGDWNGRLNGAWGRSRSEIAAGPVEAARLWNLNATLSRGPITARAAAGGGTLRMDLLEPLFSGLRAFGPEGLALAERFDVDDRAYRVATSGVEYDAGNWFTIAEIAWIDHRSGLGEKWAGYTTAGVRLGAFTPYATYARTELLSASSVAGLTLDGMPPEYAAPAAALNGGLNRLLNAAPAQQSLSLGGRWDFAPGIALKAQLDLIDMLGSSYGTFVNVQPGMQPGGRARLFSVATAFVF